MSNCFRVGRVTVYLRGRTWYLRYHEQGRRRGAQHDRQPAQSALRGAHRLAYPYVEQGEGNAVFGTAGCF